MQKENMQNNILTQIYNDPKSENKPLFDYVKFFCDKYVNTINNKVKEEKYKNAEDSRILDNEKIIKASEFGMCIDDKELYRTGSCIRKVFLQLIGAIGLPREVSEIEIHERNNLIIKQWMNKLDFLKIIKKPEHKVIDQMGLKIQSTEEAFIYDPRSNITYGLLIKPVNDTAFSIRDKLFPQFDNQKPQILNSHLAEIIMNMLILKKPIKIIYVGKNDPKLVREFDCGISNKRLTVNGEIKENINVLSVFKDVKELQHALDNNIIPPKKYKKIQTNQEEAIGLFDLGFINKKEFNEILNGKEYLNFYCNSCRFRNVCNNISPEWSKI